MAAGDGLETGTDDLLAVALAKGDSYRAAGQAAGMSESTVRRRMQDELFRRRVSRLRSELVDAAAGQASAALVAAITTLVDLLDSGNGSVQLGAAKSLLDASLRLREQGEIEERVTAVEDQLAKLGTAPLRVVR